MITQKAKARCAAHSLQEQLEMLRAQMGIIKEVKTLVRNDQSDIDHMLAADAWAGHHTRLVMPIGGAD